MIERKSYFSLSELDSKAVIEEMLKNSESKYWYECREFVRRYVQLQAKNIPIDCREDVVQNVMIRITVSLYGFRYQSTLQTWFISIIRNCVIDYYRKIGYLEQYIMPMAILQNTNDDAEKEENSFINTFLSLEEKLIISDNLRRTLEVLWEYVDSHANSARNKQILEMVLFQSCSHEEVAKLVGCSAPVVSYVVRSAQRYMREQMK